MWIGDDREVQGFCFPEMKALACMMSSVKYIGLFHCAFHANLSPRCPAFCLFGFWPLARNSRKEEVILGNRFLHL